MTLEEKFKAAGKVIKGLPKDGSFQPSNEVKLEFYSLYKQATEGVCSGTRPGWWDMEARAKYDAWYLLKNMDKNTAMSQYIELIKLFIETMTFSSEVEGFMEIIGPFYETVDVDEDQSDSKDSENNLTEEEQDGDIYQTIEQMIGRYVPPVDGLYNVDPDEEFIKRNPCKGDALIVAKPKSTKRKVSRKKPQLLTDSEDSDCDVGIEIGDLNNEMLMEGDSFIREIEETKKALDATQEILKDVRAERAKLNCGFIKESFEDETIPSQMNLDKMLGRYDGFVPPTIDIKDLQISLDLDDDNQNNVIIKDGSNSCSALELYEQSIDFKDEKDAFVSDNNQIDQVEIQDSNDSLSSDDEIFEDPMTEDLIESNDSGISEELESNKSFSKSIDFALSNRKSPNSKSKAHSLDSTITSNSLSGSMEKTKSVLNAPIHVRRTPSCQSVARYECEEDEILIVSSECNDIREEIIMKGGHEAGRLSQSRHSFDYSYQVHWTVERLSRDMDHVMARMNTLEALVTVHRQVERNSSGPSWWPFQELKPKTLLFVVTWPLIAHGLIVLLKAAARRARR